MSETVIPESNEISILDEDTESTTQNDSKPLQCISTMRKKYMNEIIHDLPGQVKNRIKALKVIQLSTTELEAQFYKEVHSLENKYHSLYQPFFEKRGQIISGTYAPTEEECKWTLEDPSELVESVKELKETEAAGEIVSKDKDGDEVIGVPDFWLTIFKNVSLLSEYVQEHDEPILKHLHDIKISYQIDPMGFTLEFHFTPNEYFTNSILTKQYFLKCVPDQEDPFSFEGPEIYKSQGCTIDWNKGKNLTMRLIKKKQRHKSRGSIRTVMKQVPNDSFFNFFSPPILPDDISEVDDETQVLLSNDYEIGHYLRERIVPRAILYYTGEGLEDDEEEEELEDEEDLDTDDEEKHLSKFDHLKVGNHKLYDVLAKSQECKQQ